MKKLLFVLLLVTGNVRADAGSAFATGFANALNRQMGGNPNDSRPEPVQQVEVYSAPAIIRQRFEIRAIREDGSEGPVFMNYSGCRSFVSHTFGFADCSMVTSNY